MTYDVTIDGKDYRLELDRVDGGWACRGEGGGGAIKRERTPVDMHLWVGSVRYAVQLRDPRSLRSRASADDGKGPRKLLAPMPGKVVRILGPESAEAEA